MIHYPSLAFSATQNWIWWKTRMNIKKIERWRWVGEPFMLAKWLVPATWKKTPENGIEFHHAVIHRCNYLLALDIDGAKSGWDIQQHSLESCEQALIIIPFQIRLPNVRWLLNWKRSVACSFRNWIGCLSHDHLWTDPLPWISQFSHAWSYYKTY